MDSIKRKELMFLVAVFLFACLLRLLFCLFFRGNILSVQSNIFTDTRQYISVARNLLEGNGIILSRETIAKITPVYPLFLAGVYFLFGEGYWAIRIIQIIISSLCCILVYFLAKDVLNKSTAQIATVIVAIYPFFIFFTAFILTETLFILLLLLTVYFFQKSKKPNHIGNSIFAGILFGISILCRPSLAAFFFVILFALFIPSLWVGWENRFRTIGIIFVFTILTISPWSIRNFYHFGKFVPLTTIAGTSFWEGNNPYSLGGPCQYWPKEVETLSEVERDRYLTDATLKIIRENPLRFLKLLGIKFVRFWNIVPNYEGFYSPLYKLVSLFSYVPIIITALLGMFLTRKIWRNFVIFYLLFFSFTLGHMLFVSSIRYRIPIMPLLIIFSGYGVNQIYRRITKGAQG